MSYIPGIFEKMMSFTQFLNQDLEQGKLMAAVNCLQKTQVLMIVIDWNLARSFRKVWIIVYENIKKMDKENLIIVAL